MDQSPPSAKPGKRPEHRERLRRRDDVPPDEHTRLQALLAEVESQRAELERQNRELREAHAALRLHAQVFDQSADAMMITDADNNIVAVNRAFCALSGYGVEELLGRNPSMLKSGRHGRDFYREMWAVLLRDGVWQGELWNRRKNGEVYPEWMTINAVREGGRIVSHFAVSSDLSQRQAKEELQRLRRLDVLTGLPSRLLLEDRVAEAVGHARLHDRYVALLHLNLDNFRFVNDSLGHLAGDETLCEMANRFTACVGSGGTVSRLSGDSFVVSLDDLNSTAAVDKVADALLAAAAKPLAVSGTEVILSACIGIALFPNDGNDFQALLRAADVALAQARDNGRNSYSYCTQELNERARRTLAMAAELRRALEDGWFVLHYQPQVATANGEVTGVEALLRMRHPSRGLVQPDEFIPIAEETGMIVPIGAWVMREACRQLKRWRQAGHHRLNMSINLSPLQFTDPQLFATIEGVIAAEGVDPQLLELEFTENAAIRNVKATVAVMNRLKNMGVRLSIDDFGAGYSGLAYLKQFPIDGIKIHQSFVRNLTHDPNDASIVQAIVAMARAMGIATIAEGVETEAQAGYLRTLHCDRLQGFFVAHPAPAADIETLFAHRLVDRDAPARTLLVVDDEENVLNAMRRLLRSEGYRVLTAASGEAALELLGSNNVGVIVSDQRMPGMTGIELLGRARQMHPDTVRIILSGYSEASTIAEAVNKGEIFKYVAKPWNNEELIALLRRAFERHEEMLSAKVQ